LVRLWLEPEGRSDDVRRLEMEVEGRTDDPRLATEFADLSEGSLAGGGGGARVGIARTLRTSSLETAGDEARSPLANA
jgi:hypothetical protein